MQAGLEPPPPVCTLLGAQIQRVDLAAGELEVHYVAQPSFANPAGGVQGGMLGAMLDDLCAGLVDATLDRGQIVATLNLNLSFLRGARSGSVQGLARLRRRGREVCHVQAELRQNGQLVASAVATCMILSPQVPTP
jgi:uncharacterized protein (TIGR00369 family)